MNKYEKFPIDYFLSEIFPTKKKEYSIQVYKPPIGTNVHNKFEQTDYITNAERPFVLIGTQGEEWAISEKDLLRKYRATDGSIISANLIKDEPVTIKAKAGVERLFAIHVPLASTDANITANIFTIETSWGDILIINDPSCEHGKGDYVIIAADDKNNPNYDNMWVVNGSIFPNTYESNQKFEFVTNQSRLTALSWS